MALKCYFGLTVAVALILSQSCVEGQGKGAGGGAGGNGYDDCKKVNNPGDERPFDVIIENTSAEGKITMYVEEYHDDGCISGDLSMPFDITHQNMTFKVTQQTSSGSSIVAQGTGEAEEFMQKYTNVLAILECVMKCGDKKLVLKAPVDACEGQYWEWERGRKGRTVGGGPLLVGAISAFTWRDRSNHESHDQNGIELRLPKYKVTAIHQPLSDYAWYVEEYYV